jgi:hypothetical protein
VEARDQPRKRFLRTGLKLRDQCRFFGLQRQRAGYVAHGEVRLHSVSSHITAKFARLASTLFASSQKIMQNSQIPNARKSFCCGHSPNGPQKPPLKPHPAAECAENGTSASNRMSRALYYLRHRNPPQVFPVTRGLFFSPGSGAAVVPVSARFTPRFPFQLVSIAAQAPIQPSPILESAGV